MLGVTEASEWSQQRSLPAPWMEVQIPNKLTLTIPSRLMRRVSNPSAFFDVWSRGMDVVNSLAGMEQSQGGRFREERFVFDLQCLVGERQNKCSYIKLI